MTALLGSSIAKQVILAGRDISAQEAIRWGLAIDGEENALETAQNLSEELSNRSPEALWDAKKIIDERAEDLSLANERSAQSRLYALRK